MTEYMMDPAISNLVKTVPRLDRLIAAQRARAVTLPAEKRVQLLRRVEELEGKIVFVRQRCKNP